MSDLQEIEGIGNSVEANLRENVGIESINELASCDLEELQEADVRGAEKIWRRAKKRGVVVKPGDDVAEEQADKDHIPTGIDGFDNALGGGLEPGFLIGVSGEHKAGKTQFTFQALAAAAEATGDPAVYIETEPNRFQADRIMDICGGSDAYSNIYKVEAYSLEQQMIAYDAVVDNFDSISLFVVDSFVANFRLSDKFEGRGDLKERSNLIARHLRRIQDIAVDMDAPALITLQVYGNPNQYDSSVPIWGGALMHHTITFLIHMSQAKGELREAQIRGHPGNGDEEIVVKITDDGVEEA